MMCRYSKNLIKWIFLSLWVCAGCDPNREKETPTQESPSVQQGKQEGRKSPPPSCSHTASPAPYPIGGGVIYDPVAMGNNLAGLLGSLFGSDDHCYREDPSVQQTIQKIEESTQALRRKNAEVNRLENQRAEAEHARHAVAMRASDEAWQKIHEEQGEEKEKPYCRNLSVGAMREDIDYLRENLADYPELDSPLPREIEEDMHITLSHIAQEESELADFDRRIRDVPLGGGTQWSADYYNCRGAEQARAMLQSIKENIASIISERSVVLVNSEFASVREAACSVIQAIQANVSFRQSLQCAIEAYQKACAEHEEFQQLRSALTILEAQLTHDPTNAVLVEQFREQEAVFRQHPLYQEGVQLALAAQKLREDELAKAMHTMPSRFELKAGVVSQKLKQRTLHNQTAQAIRDELLQPVRAILARPSTPLRSRLAVQAAQGVAENVVDTAKLVVLAAKILGGSVHSLVTLKDKLGIGEKIRDYSALIKALFQKWQYEWENPAEYRLRLQTAQAYRTKLLLAEKALNAEVYHKRDAREVGYWSTEAIQWVFGGEIIKGAARVAGRSAEAIRASERVAQGIESSVKVVGRAVDAVMDAHDLADLLQQNMQLNEQEEGEEEDRKMPSLPRVTTFTTPAAAQEAVEAFLARWRLETPTGRVALQEQGKSLLKSVEVVKKSTKQSYRHQVLGFETQDVDPLVWNRVLQEQEATKVHLNAIRGLRSQLLEACQVHGQELQEVAIRTTFGEDVKEEVLYSSDEDEQQLSDQSRRNHAAFVSGIGQVLQGRAEGLLTLVEDPIGTTITHCVTLLSSIPEFPELLCDYIEEFLLEADEERRAEMLGDLLTEVILRIVPLPKGKANRLHGVKNKLGKAAQQVASEEVNINRLNTLVRKGKAPKSIRRFDQNKSVSHTLVEHVHFEDGSALRKDGIWRHGSRRLTNQEIKFLKNYGWEIPE